MSSLFQSLTENEVGNGCCLFNVEEARTDAVGRWVCSWCLYVL